MKHIARYNEIFLLHLIDTNCIYVLNVGPVSSCVYHCLCAIEQCPSENLRVPKLVLLIIYILKIRNVGGSIDDR